MICETLEWEMVLLTANEEMHILQNWVYKGMYIQKAHGVRYDHNFNEVAIHVSKKLKENLKELKHLQKHFCACFPKTFMRCMFYRKSMIVWGRGCKVLY